ncbi:sulfotransferase 1C2-like [Centruroides sculpturatus]|uniref:sulfotransferase 1C2-like n=1 Tax=Centruroides sculpturatus TaxID=218467 RepID=UPI000C6DFB2B|nr:sulfotransferase 1C2-like [Centruroides sculpturatus]
MEDEIKRPNYIDCDGFLIVGAFSREAFRSAVNYKPKPGQLFIVAHPKCGTTWLQQIVAQIFNKDKPVNNIFQMKNSPFLEFAGADAVDYMDEPGAIKIHLPFNLTPYSPDAKYIYVARNPKDCCVSFYHHTKNLEIYNFADGTFDEYFELFINGKKDYGDYFDHLLSWYEHKDDPNVLFITYEDLKLDTRNYILKIAKFMGDEYHDILINNPDILENVLRYSSLKHMKDNARSYIAYTASLPEGTPIPSGAKAFRAYLKKHPELSPTFKGNLVRKGIIGDWKNHFSPEQERRMEDRIKEKTAGTDVMSLWKDK